jgi:hypothetical protein
MDEDTPSSSITTTNTTHKPRVAAPESPKRFSSRSEGLRSAGATGGAFQKKGRSLADLASKFPSSGRDRERSTGHSHRHTEERGGTNSSSSGYLKDFVDDKKVIRYTRERLLSMRPRVESDAVRPDVLKVLDGIGVLSDGPLDPVCWDSFDADEIWNQARERNTRNKSSSTGNPRQDVSSSSISSTLNHKDRSHSRPREGSSWQRGVALPPADHKKRESSNPDDLWDDPSIPTEAAADFSAFGGSLEDDPRDAGGAFDLASMAEATKAFDDQVRGTTTSSEVSHDHAVNPTRPLASAGTTIRSGSGDDVNVFEDFDAPNNNDTIQSGNVESVSASSRLMQMIGVEGTDVTKEQQEATTISSNTTSTGDNFNIGGFNSIPSISSNPWGAPMPSTTTTTIDTTNTGLDLAAKIRESTNMEMEMRRKQEEERQRVAALEAQRQAAIQSQQQQQAQQAQPEYSSVELILCERVSTILENSWGRSDLMTILQTLHNDDARVVPLLGTVEALKALLQRHPHRFGLTKDPTFGAEMAVLIMNNAQYTQQKANEELKKRQEEEQLKMREAEAKAREQVVITDDPWFYADPQGNIQGPFKGNEMRQWLEAGYFKGDLPISQNQNGGFRTLASLFPDLSVAFKPTVSGPSEEELQRMEAAKQRAEAEARQIAERAERERLMKEQQEKEAAAAAEAARMAAEAQNNQNQSAQLKMMLGLGSAGVNAGVSGVANRPPVDVVEALPEAQDRPEKEVAPQSPQSKPNSKPKKEVETAAVKEEPVTAAPAAAPATPAWGGASSKPTENKKKSMSEIQKEEARVSAKAAKEKASQSSGGGWAGIAASGGTTAWTGTTAKATPAIVSSGPTASTTHRTSTAQKSKPSSTNSTQETLEQFGADDKMTPDLENWCKQQMKKLNGSEDLTLVAFCMTLSDPMEIKQYLTAYLGSTPQVNNFASEFISRKNGTKQQEQWETTSKKNRKKKSAK